MTTDERKDLERLVKGGHYYDAATLEIIGSGLWLRRLPWRCPKDALCPETDAKGKPVLRPALWYLGAWRPVLAKGRALDENWP